MTTDYVVDETLSLYKYRGHPRRALLFGEDMRGPSPIAAVYHVSRADVAAAWVVFRRFADKDWSFTDCVSKVVMERLGLTAAFLRPPLPPARHRPSGPRLTRLASGMPPARRDRGRPTHRVL